MGYCRNCRAQIKGASVCPSCGTERINPKKRSKHLSEHPDGATALRKGFLENRTLLLCIIFATTVDAVLSLIASARALPEEGILPLATAVTALTSLLFPIGLLLLLREARKSGSFSTLGFRLAEVSILCSGIPLLVWAAIPMDEHLGNLYTFLWWTFLKSFESIYSLLVSLPILCLFGLLFWWMGYEAVLCHRLSKLATENKRFRISRFYEFLLLASAGLFIFASFRREPTLISFIGALSAGAANCMLFVLLTKLKKRI